jgi:hypothetical protein
MPDNYSIKRRHTQNNINTYYCSEQYEIFSSLTRSRENSFLNIHRNNKYFYTADSHIYANNNKKETAVVSIATYLTPMCNNVTLYVRCLPCFI